MYDPFSHHEPCGASTDPDLSLNSEHSAGVPGSQGMTGREMGWSGAREGRKVGKGLEMKFGKTLDANNVGLSLQVCFLPQVCLSGLPFPGSVFVFPSVSNS